MCAAQYVRNCGTGKLVWNGRLYLEMMKRMRCRPARPGVSDRHNVRVCHHRYKKLKYPRRRAEAALTARNAKLTYDQEIRW